jgi:RNA polymerase sigma factor (sigma-70 family)
MMRKRTEANDSLLWGAYLTSRCDVDRNAIFDFHYQWICEEVRRYLKKLHVARIYDDVLSHVAEKILTATIPEFNLQRSTNFRRQLACHVRFGIQEFLRSKDQNRRRRIDRATAVRRGRDELAQILGYMPNDRELAEYLKWDEQSVIDASLEPETQIDVIALSLDEPNAFENMIQDLPESYREILTMYYVDGYIQEEIAERLGVTQATVCEQMDLAKEILRGDH